MIEYILISYVIMFLWCAWSMIIDDEQFKGLFKVWLLSPVSLPFFLICKFISW